MTDVYLSLGSNIGEPENNIRDAVLALARLPETSVHAVSPFYITAPVGYAEQQDFINICVALKTGMPAEALLGCCLGIEASMGRLRPFKNSPRIIDIDLLLYGDSVFQSDFLTLPHPRMKERAFVLVPLNDILSLERKKALDIDTLLKNTSSQRIKRLDKPIIAV